MNRMRLEEQIYFNSRDLENLSAKVLYVFQSRPLGDLFKSEPLRLDASPRSIKLFEMGNNIPLVRLDYPSQGKNPPMHLQYGKGEEGNNNPNRNGDEAADILAEIMRLTKRPLSFFPSIEDENKD